MTDDIVARLRQDFTTDPIPLHAEAADEIDRVRAENEDLRRWKALDKPLTAAMSIANGANHKLCDKIGKLEAELILARAEIGTLRAAIRALVSAVANDKTNDIVLRSRAYAEAQRLCASVEQKERPEGK